MSEIKDVIKNYVIHFNFEETNQNATNGESILPVEKYGIVGKLNLTNINDWTDEIITALEQRFDVDCSQAWMDEDDPEYDPDLEVQITSPSGLEKSHVEINVQGYSFLVWLPLVNPPKDFKMEQSDA